MQVVNTNIASLNAQINLSNNGSTLATSLQRLSSGLRINSAKDDAAGMAIATRMNAQVKGLNQAVRNANDGVSLAQTAEGALATIGDNLQRIRELAVQSANASNSASDRASMQNEVSALVAEIDRVANNTSFNGVKVIDGSFAQQSFQVGANGTANDQITVSSIGNATASSLSIGGGAAYTKTIAASSNNSTGATALAAAGVTINTYNVGAAQSDGVSFANSSSSAIAVAAAVNAISGQSGVTATVGANSKAGGGSVLVSSQIASNDVLINGVDIGPVSSGTSNVTFGNAIAAAINAITASTGVTATASTTDGTLTLNAADGRNITIGGTGTGASIISIAQGTYSGKVGLTTTGSAGITIGGTTAGMTASGFTTGYNASTLSAASALNIGTAAGATTALTTIDAAISSINVARAALGALQNRFASTISTLQTTSENISAAKSRIQDADFAAETAALTRGQILQQAGTAMLAQANSLPQSVLSLLK